MASLTRLTLKGFKSIESLDDFELRPLNILIGANGAGKSNFVGFFRILRAMTDQTLQEFIMVGGGAEGFFHLGSKITPRILATLRFGDFGYEYSLLPTASGHVVFEEEAVRWLDRDMKEDRVKRGNEESYFIDRYIMDFADTLPEGPRRDYFALLSLKVYHFNDSSLLAGMRREQSVRDFDYLREDGTNIAPFLLRVREQNKGLYEWIRDAVKIAAPFFDDFILEPYNKGPAELIRLEWRQKGNNYRFQPWQLSDGLIRFICLATALLQPNPPALIVIDEPELGLHPSALVYVANMISSISVKAQVIVSTQSPRLVDEFEPEDVVVVDREKGHSLFRRLAAKELAEWVAEYSLGELWEKGVLRGGPHSE